MRPLPETPAVPPLAGWLQQADTTARAVRGARSYFALTVTSITTSTLTVSVATTNSATTVSLSVYCTLAGGATLFPRC